MEIWEHPIPHYLTDKGNIFKTVIFTAAFALLFINIYAPFGVDTWFDVSRTELLMYSSFVILAGVLVVVNSRIIMYQVSKNTVLRYGHYAIWIGMEILCMALVYALIEKLVLNDPRVFWEALIVAIQNTALIILLPYAVLWLYFSLKDKREKLEALMEKGDSQEMAIKMMPFYDERGVLKLSIKRDDVYYLEAADNYVTINYLENQKLKTYLLRSTLKRLEDTMEPASFLRCHRSFIINSDKVQQIRKERDGLVLIMEHPVTKSIPLSKTYSDHFLRNFAGLQA
jgi:hypothetical protein